MDDHWADVLDEQLKCDINSRDKLLKIGAEHPSINKIIDLKLPCLSSFFEAYKRVNNIFMETKMLMTTGGVMVQYFITHQS